MNAGLTLHVPQGRTAGEAEVFVRAHRRWVAEKVAVRERTRPLTPPKRLVDGEVFRYLGRTYRLSVDTERPADARCGSPRGGSSSAVHRQPSRTAGGRRSSPGTAVWAGSGLPGASSPGRPGWACPSPPSTWQTSVAAGAATGPLRQVVVRAG